MNAKLIGEKSAGKNKAIKFAVVQSGYAVFGVGSTYKKAIIDATKWMTGDAGESLTVKQVAELLVNRHSVIDGDFYIMDSSDENFDRYLKNQGGFVKRNGRWYAE